MLQPGSDKLLGESNYLTRGVSAGEDSQQRKFEQSAERMAEVSKPGDWARSESCFASLGDRSPNEAIKTMQDSRKNGGVMDKFPKIELS